MELAKRLQEAVNNGFVPADLKEAMNTRGHQGDIGVVYDEDRNRIKVGYTIGIDDDEHFETHIHWYELAEVEEMLA